jgi:hypothetical protein
MAGELIPAGEAYAYALLEMWSEILTDSQTYRENLLGGRMENSLLYKYVSRMAILWNELLPKFDGAETKYGKAFVDEFKSYRDLYEHPELPFANPEKHAPRIVKLQSCLRTALEKLNITKFEK